MLAFALSLSLVSFAAAARSVRSIDSAPEGWNKVSRVGANETIHLRISLASADITALHDTLEAVSTPGNARYGKHLTKEEMGALVAPSAETASSVKSWLNGVALADVAKANIGGDVLTIPTTVGVAEKLLAPAQWWVFQSNEDPERKVRRTLRWGVPEDLKDAVETMHPSNLFPAPAHEPRVVGLDDPIQAPIQISSNATDAASCASTFTPTCARSQYGLGSHQNTANAKNRAAIFSDEGHASTSDLKNFLKTYVPAHSSATFKLVNINGGGNAGGDANIEADLDAQVLVGLSSPAPVSLFVGNDDGASQSDEWPSLIRFADYLEKLSPVPSVASISYGGAEASLGDESFMKSTCNAFAKLGTLGTSVLASSGDSGVALEKKGGAFHPNFPASCPYVTAVGGTYKVPAIADTMSGGGFSTVFARPAWQKSAVSAYLSYLGNTHKGQFDASGRGYPDLAAMSRNWPISVNGQFEPIGGTSASCPTVASVIQHLNDVQLKAGKSTLGFLNPWLYKHSAAVNDVTSGYSAGNMNGYTPELGVGFKAHKGWDPATGLGTPNFAALEKVLP